MSLVVASAGTSKPICASTSTLSSVAIATCAAATPGVLATWPADLQQRDGVGVRARPQLDVVVLMRRIACGVEREPGALQQAATGRGADRGQGGLRGRRGGPASAANSGSTSPCRAQSSRVAESSVVRAVRAARPRRQRACGSPAAYLVASQPQTTSSPYG